MHYGKVSILGAQLSQSEAWHAFAISRIEHGVTISCDAAEPVNEPLFGDKIITTIVHIREREDCLTMWTEEYALTKGLFTNRQTGRQYNDHSKPVELAASYLHLPASWEMALSQLSQAQSCAIGGNYMMVGAKHSGKSTFARYLANCLLTLEEPTRDGIRLDRELWYLDLDPGQPEFAEPGQMSLALLKHPYFSVAFAHEHLIVKKRHWLGQSSPKDDPAHYLACAIDLLSTVQSQGFSNVQRSMIVNTPGWITGTGADLLATIIRIGRINIVVDFGNSKFLSSLPDTLQVLRCEIPETRDRAITPTDMRQLKLLSYFHRTPYRWISRCSLYSEFWEVEYGGPTRPIAAIVVISESLMAEDVISAIDGTIVALVTTESPLPYSICSSIEGIPFSSNRGRPVNPYLSKCIGLAVVSGVDPERGTLQLITPLGSEDLENVEGRTMYLVTGNIDLPICMTSKLEGSPTPYLTHNMGTGVGWQFWHVRRNIGRPSRRPQ